MYRFATALFAATASALQSAASFVPTSRAAPTAFITIFSSSSSGTIGRSPPMAACIDSSIRVSASGERLPVSGATCRATSKTLR